MKGLVLISLVVFLAAILSESIVQSGCTFTNGEVCKKICCGEDFHSLVCQDSCVGVECSSNDECGAGCCSHGVCTNSCPLRTVIVWVIGGIFMFLVFCAAPCALFCWCRHRRRRATRQPGLVIVTTIVARDDSVPLMSARDPEEFSDERRQEPSSSATSHEAMVHGGPPPDYQS